MAADPISCTPGRRGNRPAVPQAQRAQRSFRQFIHLEDNEQHLLANMSGKSWKTLTALPMQELDALIPGHLSHPVRSAEFLQAADGVTVIIDRLREFVPPGVPSIELWPSADPKLFSPRPLNRALRTKLGIPAKTTVFVYTGNVGSRQYCVRGCAASTWPWRS